jgi:hypothetical protein
MSFADVEARANASIFAKLVNALATYTPAPPAAPIEASVVFDPAGGLIDELGVVTQAPMFQIPATSNLTPEDGMALSIRLDKTGAADVDYLVRSVVTLDEGGRRRVVLARA